MAFYSYPSIYLVDEAGRAVRPDWPTDGCNVAWTEATGAFAALTVADVIQYRGTKTSYTAQDLAHAAELLTRALVAEGIADVRVAATPALDAVEVASAGLDTDPARQALVQVIAERSIGGVPVVFAPCASPCS